MNILTKVVEIPIVDFFVRFVVKLSLYLCPYKFVKLFSKTINYIASRRFSYISQNTSSKVYIESPFYIIGHKYIKCGNFFSRAGLRIECIDYYNNVFYTPSVEIGNDVFFNFRCHIGAINRIVIGNNVLIGSNVLITDHSHGTSEADEMNIVPVKRHLYSKGPVIIEDNVWIGENVTILANVRIGRNSIIGANSVVVKNVPAFSIVAGNPAKIIKVLSGIML